MKKILLTILILSFYFLIFPLRAEAKINWPWQNQNPGQIRQEIREEVREQLGLTGTPSPGTPKQIRQEVQEQVKNRLEELKDKLNWLLPFGFNQVELKVISGTTIPADLTVSKGDKTYTVKVMAKTVLLRKFGGKSDLTEFSVGDILSVRGKWTDEAKTILEARVIRDLSIQKRKGTFWGTIKSKGDNLFVLSSANRGDQTVYLAGDTKIVNRKQETIIFAELLIGHRVRVSGLWDNKLNKITEVTKIKNWSIPAKAMPTPNLGLSPTPISTLAPTRMPTPTQTPTPTL